jgi:hypothetical protein
MKKHSSRSSRPPAGPGNAVPAGDGDERINGRGSELAKGRLGYLLATLRLCLVTLKSVLCKKKFSVTSNLQYMYRVLNVDKIKN